MAESPALRKRQQISKANRTMFLWVAGASALVAVALVGSYFLFNKLTFNEKVLAEKSKTVATLRHNNEVVPDLIDNVRVLSTSDVLEHAKPEGDYSTLQVILDALPADGNSLAFGASLQQKLVGNVKGLTIESATVEPVAGVEMSSGDETDATAVVVDEEGATSGSQIAFQFTAIGNDRVLRDALRNLERSIRPVAISSVSIEAGSGRELRMTVSGHTYYEPAKTVELKDKTVQP